jgi:uncharacterized protein
MEVAERGSHPPPAEQDAQDEQNEKLRQRRTRRSSFPQLVLRVTMLMHVPLVLVVGELARRLGAPYPFAWGALGAALLVLPTRNMIQAMMWDRPRPRWRLLLIEEPYFAHWCAAFFVAPFLTIICLLKLAFDAATGAPLALPATFALGFYVSVLAVAVYAIAVRRRWVAVRNLEIPLRGLPQAFDGFRIAQISDLHIGGMTPPGLPDRWVELCNAGEPDVIAVTGDLVTAGVHFHDEIARVLSGLRARELSIVAMGNHDYFGEGDPLIGKLRDKGLVVLRNDALLVRRGGESLRICAVDDTWTGRADLDRTLEAAGGRPTPDSPTILLAHDPDQFEKAHRLGANLMLSGHTHAGQLAVPFLVRYLNLARLVHKYTYGIYRKGDSTMYVHAGLGTTGPPARLGAAPEVVFFTLRVG